MPGRQQVRMRGRGGVGSCGRGRLDTGTTTATSAVLAAVGLVGQDLRDPDGVLRPLLRGAAASLAASGRRVVMSAGHRYLELDPPPRPIEIVSPSEGVESHSMLLPSATVGPDASDDESDGPSIVDDVEAES